MRLSRRVSLANVQLDELDESIVIRSVDVGVPHEDVGSADRMGGFGSRMTNQHWQSLDASVTFAINIQKNEMVRRREVFDMINAWAKPKKWLRTNQMEGRRLYVDKIVYSGGGDMRDWLREYTITFRAYSVPFWQDEIQVEAQKKKISKGNVQIEIGGTAPGVLDISFENVSGKQINDVTFTVGTQTLQLKGVNLAANETLNMSHTNEGVLRVRAVNGDNSRNVYSLLRGADDAYVEAGTAVTVAVEATRAGNITVRNTARWL